LGEIKRSLLGWPHWEQNLATVEMLFPQLPQTRPSETPHNSQNFASAGF